MAAGGSLDSALTAGYHLAFAVAVGCVLAGMLVAGLLLRPGRREPLGAGAAARLEPSGETAAGAHV
jgi:hypothetical protein